MITNYLRIYTTDTLSEALGRFNERKELYALVFTRTERLIGVISRKDLLKSRADPHTTKINGIRKFVKGVPVCKQGDDLVKVVELMLGGYPCCVAVMRGSVLKGVIRPKDLLREIKTFKTLADMKVSEIMTPDPVVAFYNTRVGDALNAMREKNIGHLPIVDRKDNHVISVLSFSDIAKQVLVYPRTKKQGRSEYVGVAGWSGKGWTPKIEVLLDAPIGDLASVSIITAKPGDNLKIIVNKLDKYNISDLIITQDNKPVGIVTVRDLLETFIRLKTPEFWDVHYIGIDHLKPFHAKAVREVVNEKFEKIRRAYFNLKDIVYLAVHIKFYEEGLLGERPGDGRTKYSVRLRLAVPAFVIVVDEVHFDLMTAVQWALDELDRKVRDRLVKTRKKDVNIGKGRRAMFQHFMRKQAANLDLRPAFAKLIKRK